MEHVHFLIQLTLKFSIIIFMCIIHLSDLYFLYSQTMITLSLYMY